MNPVQIDWMNLDLAFETNGKEAQFYLNRQTGQVVMITDEIERYVDEPPEEPLPDWMQQAVQEAVSALEEDSEQYVAIPRAETSEDYRDMEEFVATIRSTRLQEQLSRAIHGSGAFRRFKDILADHPTERDHWHAFHDARQRQRLDDWLEDIGIVPANPRAPVSAPPPPVETTKGSEAEYQELIEELALLLLYLCSWEEKSSLSASVRKAWKGFTFETLNALEDRGLLHQSRKARSVTLTDEGIALARELETRFKP